MDNELYMKIALGLQKAPPGFDYSKFECDPRRECIVESESDVVGRESDCVIVGSVEKKTSLSSFVNEGCFEFDGKFGDENKDGDDNGDDKEVKFEHLTKEDIKKEDCDGDQKHVGETGNSSDLIGSELQQKFSDVYRDNGIEDVKLKDPKKEDCDGDHKHVGKEGNSAAKYDALIASELEEKLQKGTKFPDLENVYLLYCEYTRVKGFSVRKGEQRYFGRSNNIRWKEFLCSCTGLPNNGKMYDKIGVYQKLVTRSDCRAKVAVSRTDLGSFSVCIFEKEHNHEMLDSDQSFQLRSSRSMSYAKKSVLEALTGACIGVSKAFNFMEKESGGIQNVGFTKRDAYRHLDDCRLETKIEDGDARMLVEYFMDKSEQDPFFFYRYQVDDDGRLMNIFFRDNRCYLDYDAFGDVLSVDTTYRTNKYNLMCLPFVGINHHTRNVMFGFAMLSNETTATFTSLFETFLRSMHGKQPKCVFSDQCKALMNAIDAVFPQAKHRLCQWHIMQNCASHFGKLHGYATFNALWYRCMNIVESEKDFDRTWEDMMEEYEIPDMPWFDGMHKICERWASCFSRGTFTAGLLATSRSELTNRCLKQVVRKNISLTALVKECDGILKNWRNTERKEDAFSIWVSGQAVTKSGLLKKAAQVFTRTIYKQLEHDYANCQSLIIEPKGGVHIAKHLIRYYATGREFKSIRRRVDFNSETKHASYDCGKWETEGLICRHILKVFAVENVDHLPDSLIYPRWTKGAKEVKEIAVERKEETEVMKHITFSNEFMRHMAENVVNAMLFEPLRLKLAERLTQINKECKEMVRKFVPPDMKRPPLIVPLFRDPKKIPVRGSKEKKNKPYVAKNKP